MEDIILNLNLFYVKPQKFLYNWKNKRSSLVHIVARLDHFLASDNLLVLNIFMNSSIFPWCGSNH